MYFEGNFPFRIFAKRRDVTLKKEGSYFEKSSMYLKERRHLLTFHDERDKVGWGGGGGGGGGGVITRGREQRKRGLPTEGGVDKKRYSGEGTRSPHGTKGKRVAEAHLKGNQHGDKQKNLVRIGRISSAGRKSWIERKEATIMRKRKIKAPQKGSVGKKNTATRHLKGKDAGEKEHSCRRRSMGKKNDIREEKKGGVSLSHKRNYSRFLSKETRR